MIPIEDNFTDVLKKAIHGQGLNRDQLAERAGLSESDLCELLDGNYDQSKVNTFTKILGLNGDCLHELANDAQTSKVELPDGIILHNTPFPIPGYEEMTVNCYSIVDPSRPEEGVLIDAGATFNSLLETAGAAITRFWQLILTHTHPDHITHLSSLSGKVSTVYSPSLEHLPDTKTVGQGDAFTVGGWQLTAIETPGHSPGGTSYLLEGAAVPVLFVGDAIFCYSIGKVHQGYEAALEAIRLKILNLPGETILCPGHGPLTTVGFERSHNPFFA